MRIRTQLILAAFILAVVPLAAIVTYSYRSSRLALESAYRAEADRLTRQMDRRLSTIRAELDQRMMFVSSLPLPSASSPDAGSIATAMGESARFVDALEFRPLEEPPDTDPNPQPTEAAEPVQVAVHPQPPPAPEAPEMSMIIDLPTPEIPRYVMSEQQRELLTEISRLGAQMGSRKLTRDEREDLAREMEATQKELEVVIAGDRRSYREQRRAARRTLPQTHAVAAPAPAPVVAAVAPVSPVQIRKITASETAKTEQTEKKSALILGRNFQAPVRKEGEVVGQLTARISAEHVVRRVLGSATDDRSEVPFAIDREGTVYTRSNEDRQTLDRLGIPQRVAAKRSLKGIDGWIVSTSTDPQSGLRIGVARPVGENLEELRRTAARNFGLGLGLIALALVGIAPLSNHLTRDVKLVTEGAERIAHGDLMTRLPVKTKNELGQLARAFNQMAEDLSVNQQKLLDQERAQKEQELQQKLMAVEYERKTAELEEARRFQLSMLPKEVPRHDAYEVAVFTRTATEVGGDYYDFHLAGDVLSVTIGDATGHGAKAGTMVTVVKTLFAAHTGESAPQEFLRSAAETIKRMELGRMSIALSLGRFTGHSLTLASAGMPPVLVHRVSSSQVDEVSLGSTPLGTLGTDYPETTVALAPGDTVLFLTDGFPELMNDAGQQLGYSAALEAFADAARGERAQEVIDSLVSVARTWHGDTAPNDDVTFVVVRMS